MEYRARGLLQRPEIKTEIRRVRLKEYWPLFSKYHYINNSLNSSAKCFVLFVENKPVSFCGILHIPLKNINHYKRISRAVTLPDYQGIGFVHVLSETLGSAYSALGFKLRAYPKHPMHVRAMYKLKNWKVIKTPSSKQPITKRAKILGKGNYKAFLRPKSTCAILEYIGQKIEKEIAEKLINGSI